MLPTLDIQPIQKPDPRKGLSRLLRGWKCVSCDHMDVSLQMSVHSFRKCSLSAPCVPGDTSSGGEVRHHPCPPQLAVKTLQRVQWGVNRTSVIRLRGGDTGGVVHQRCESKQRGEHGFLGEQCWAWDPAPHPRRLALQH